MTTHQSLVTSARDGEPDRLAAALLGPDPQRAALLALAAFSSELRRIPATVREPMMGEIRLQWWRDTITAGAATGNPVADALIEAIRTHNLPPAFLIAMTEARAFDLYDDPMPDRASLEGYLMRTEGALFELGMRVMGGSPDAGAVALCTLAAQSYGLIRLLADLPTWLQRGRSPLPRSLFDAGLVSTGMPLGSGFAQDLGVLADALKPDITATYDAARQRVGILSRLERLPFLPLAVVPPYQRRIATASRTPLRAPIVLAPILRMTRIAVAHVIGQV